MKVLLETSEYKEIDIEFPFYAYVQEEDSEIFVKIEENCFRKIVLHFHGAVEIFKNTTKYNYLARVWYNNKSDEKTWNIALYNLNNYIKKFK